METINTSCPFCQSEKTKQYSYGRLGFSSEGEREEYRKKYIDGGCEFAPDSPRYHCEHCGKDFGRVDGKDATSD